MIHDATHAWRRLFFSWGMVFLLGFLLVRVNFFHVFLHWIPLAVLGLAMTIEALKYTGRSPWLVASYWIVVIAVIIGMTGMVFNNVIPYPTYIPMWGMAVLGFLGLAHAIFGLWIRNRSFLLIGGLWIRNRSFLLIGGLWMITAAALWGTLLFPNDECVVLAFATSIPYFIAGLSYKTKVMKVTM